MGIMLSATLTQILGFSNGADLIMYAFGGTALSFFGMASLAGTIKRDLSNFGKFLFVGLIMLIIASIVSMFFQSTLMVAVLSALGVGLFSAYILYDIKRIIDGGETNYISATLSLYISIFNVFQNLLVLFGIFGGNND
jgi:FtsH-binding integral membrane protein